MSSIIKFFWSFTKYCLFVYLLMFWVFHSQYWTQRDLDQVKNTNVVSLIPTMKLIANHVPTVAP